MLVAIALVGATLITVPKAFAQNAPRSMVSAVDLEIAPAQLDKFLEALRENGASTIKEPHCRQYDILQLISEPNQIHIYEVYENEAAVQAHRASDHFKKYRATTKNMMVKSQSRRWYRSRLILSRDNWPPIRRSFRGCLSGHFQVAGECPRFRG